MKAVALNLQVSSWKCDYSIGNKLYGFKQEYYDLCVLFADVVNV
jgi:hypothetical protein